MPQMQRKQYGLPVPWFHKIKGKKINTLSPKEEIIAVLSGEDIGYFPRSIPVFTPVVDMMNVVNAYFPSANYTGEEMANLAVCSHSLAKWHSTMIPWASTVEMEALGCEVINKEDDIAGYPQCKKKAFDEPYDVVIPEDILEKGSFPAVFEATRIVRKKLDDDYTETIPIVSMFQGPFTIASYIIGVNEMFKLTLKDKERAAFVLDKVADLLIMYGSEMLKNGGDLINMADPVAEGLMPRVFTNLVVPVYRKITEGIKGEKMIHVCGRTQKIAPLLPETGFNAFSFDYPAIEVKYLKEALGDKMKLVGSVPTVTHFLEGKPQDVIDMSHWMIESGVDILSPSCGLPQYSPLENVKAMADAIEIWNKKKS